MRGASYIALSKEFIDGIEEWIQIRGFDKEHIIEVGAGMGELGKRLDLKEDNVTDLRLASTANNYDPFSPNGFKTCDENKNEADEEESEIPEGLDSSGTLEKLFPDDTDDEELDESDIVFWDFV